MRIIVSNDDGVHARGLALALQTLQPFGELLVVAPSKPRSATGHAITLHKPLRMWHATGCPRTASRWATSCSLSRRPI
jgi:5'/3'-nucleotidase SurE